MSEYSTVVIYTSQTLPFSSSLPQNLMTETPSPVVRARCRNTLLCCLS